MGVDREIHNKMGRSTTDVSDADDWGGVVEAQVIGERSDRVEWAIVRVRSPHSKGPWQ